MLSFNLSKSSSSSTHIAKDETLFNPLEKDILAINTTDSEQKATIEKIFDNYNSQDIIAYSKIKYENGNNFVMQYAEQYPAIVNCLLAKECLTHEILASVNDECQNLLIYIVQNEDKFNFDYNEALIIVNIAGYNGIMPKIGYPSALVSCFVEISDMNYEYISYQVEHNYDCNTVFYSAIFKIMEELPYDQQRDILRSKNADGKNILILNIESYNEINDENIKEIQEILQLLSSDTTDAEELLAQQDNNGNNIITLALDSRLCDDARYSKENINCPEPTVEAHREFICSLIRQSNKNTLLAKSPDNINYTDGINALYKSLVACFADATDAILMKLNDDDILTEKWDGKNILVNMALYYRGNLEELYDKFNHGTFKKLVNQPSWHGSRCDKTELSFFTLIKKPELLKIILDNKLIDENNLTALNLKKQNIITAIIECDKLKNIDSLLELIDSYPNNKDIYKTLLSVDNLANINELLKNLTNKEQADKNMQIFVEKANY